MIKKIEVEEGRSVEFKASAFSPIQYNKLFQGKDFMRDMATMADKKQGMSDDELSLEAEDYEMFVRLAYLFAYQALSPTPRVSEEQKAFREAYPDPWTWIDTFNTFSIYTILPEIVDLWYGGDANLVKAKNPVPAPPGK